MKQHLVQIGQKDGPTEYISQILAAIRSQLGILERDLGWECQSETSRVVQVDASVRCGDTQILVLCTSGIDMVLRNLVHKTISKDVFMKQLLLQ